MPQVKTLREAIVINAGPSRIWSVLTKAEYSRQYYYDLEIRSAWMAGSDVYWEKEEGVLFKKGKILTIIPGMFIEFTMQEQGAPESRVVLTRYELQTDEDGIRLSVIQEISSEDESSFRHQQQIWRAMLQKIKWLAEYS
ncbi:MAG: SRPBCC domain-containing protein [Bacteroidota bacterium]